VNRLCTNCHDEYVEESKQNFIYRDLQGNKWDAHIKPVCGKCIAAGEYKNERGSNRLYLGASRYYDPFKEDDSERIW